MKEAKISDIIKLGEYIMGHYQNTHFKLASQLIYNPKDFNLDSKWPDDFSRKQAERINN